MNEYIPRQPSSTTSTTSTSSSHTTYPPRSCPPPPLPSPPPIPPPRPFSPQIQGSAVMDDPRMQNTIMKACNSDRLSWLAASQSLPCTSEAVVVVVVVVVVRHPTDV
ncbi:hypothetical protein E2C01_102551 [Portunus trituberculatus]|uniref:Uncharacterized protein n=1 Tax=Portunus trituberculatus TaxID=210409 RepID=A0A5B7KIR1_PORTR|nr:hypothetical protein [Portunus trituberculatus]